DHVGRVGDCPALLRYGLRASCEIERVYVKLDVQSTVSSVGTVGVCPPAEVARPWKIETELVTPCRGHDDSVAAVVDRNPCHFYYMETFSILNVGIVESGNTIWISDAASRALTWTTNVERREILDVNTRYSARDPANIVDSEVE